MKWDIAQVKQEIRGPAALVMVPFNDDLSLNLAALAANIQYIMDGGLKTGQGFLICPCGSGEYLTLSPEEHLQVVETAVRVTDGKLPVVAGVAGIDIRHVIKLTRAAGDAGAKYAMISPPFYDSIDQDAIYEWYRILSDSVDVGIMIYDQSWRGALGTALSVPLIERLTGLENVVSLKYGGPSNFQDMIVALGQFSDRYAFLENSLGFTAVIAYIHGATSFVSGPSNWWPEFETSFFNLIEEGRHDEADHMHARLSPYMAWFDGEFSSSGRFASQAAVIKASMEYVGLYGGPVRPPFRVLNPDEKQELWATMDQMGVKKAGS